MIAGRALVLVYALSTLIWVGCSDTTTPTSVHHIQSSGDLPGLSLYGAFPNPFSSSTTLSYDVKDVSADRVECTVYNSAGERIKTYHQPSTDSTDAAVFRSRELPFAIGFSTCTWDGSTDVGQAPNGIYYLEVKLIKDDNEIVQRCLCMRKR